MGIPSFMRWIRDHYPKVFGGNCTPGQCDVLLVDMNGFIHTACHTGDGNLHEWDEQEMIDRLLQYLDAVVSICAPRHSLFLAVDGTAPRAKINQQRGRRYESARRRRDILEDNQEGVFGEIEEREGQEIDQEMEKIRQSLDTGILGDQLATSKSFDYGRDPMEGGGMFGGGDSDDMEAPDPVEEGDLTDLLGWDRNSISPGTTFMDRVGLVLHEWAARRMSGDLTSRVAPAGEDEGGEDGEGPTALEISPQAFQALKAIIVSDTHVPGEGEHKMLDFIRDQRVEPSTDPNTVYALCGMDGDLVPLGMALHDPHCVIYREVRPHNFALTPATLRFETICLETLRQYMFLEFSKVGAPRPGGKPAGDRPAEPSKPLSKKLCDGERVVNDFVLVLFFVGNDFMPHAPGCLMDRCGMEVLWALYKRLLPTLPDYLVAANGTINWESMKIYAKELGKAEDACFLSGIDQARDDEEAQSVAASIQESSPVKAEALERTSSALDDHSSAATPSVASERPVVRKAEQVAFTLEELLDQGWRDTYYSTIGVTSQAAKKDLCMQFARGLSWMLQYYLFSAPMPGSKGPKEKEQVPDGFPPPPPMACLWGFYFRSHYSPFMADLAEFLEATPSQEIEAYREVNSSAFAPFSQLLAILPPDSACLLPKELQFLMSRQSPISHFYPETYEFDSDGRQAEYKGVVVLPFIEEQELEREVGKVRIRDQATNARNRMCPSSVIYAPKAALKPKPQKDRPVQLLEYEEMRIAGEFAEGYSPKQPVNVPETKPYPNQEKGKPATIPSGIREVGAMAFRCAAPVTPFLTRVREGTRAKPTFLSNKPGKAKPLDLTSSGRTVCLLPLSFWLGMVCNELVRSLPIHGSYTGSLFYIWHTGLLLVALLGIAMLVTADTSLKAFVKGKGPSSLDELYRRFIRPHPIMAYRDWVCPRCARRNFDRNTECFRCALPRPAQPTVLYTPKQAFSDFLLDHSTSKSQFAGRAHPSLYALMASQKCQ